METDFTLQFTGTMTHKLDPKSRVAIPAVWREEELARLLFFSTEEQGHPIVKCFTKEGFHAFLIKKAKVAFAANYTADDVEEFIQAAIGTCTNADLNTQGKIVLPKSIIEHLELEDSVSLVGVGSYFKLWNPTDLKKTQEATKLRDNPLNKIFHIL